MVGRGRRRTPGQVIEASPVAESHVAPVAASGGAAAAQAPVGCGSHRFEVGLAASTVQNILNRAGLGRLDRGDRATNREPVRRYQRDTPGELIHVDVKKLAGIPDGGGWRVRGRGYRGEGAASRRVGYRYVHTAVDDRTRIAYSEIHNDENAVTAAGFWPGITAGGTRTREGACAVIAHAP